MKILGMVGPWQVLILLVGLLLPIIALVDVIRSNFKGPNDKLMGVSYFVFKYFWRFTVFFNRYTSKNKKIG